MTTEAVKIITHSDDAFDRLPEQYRDNPRMVAYARIFGAQAQDLEDAFYDILENAGLAAAFGPILDQIGEIVGQPRNGLIDQKYRVRIFAKIGQNVSKGTAEDLIAIFKALMQADRVYYNDLFPAGAYLTAIGTDPVGTIAEIRDALENSKPAGVKMAYFLSVDANSFSFLDDPDPSGLGFGDSTDPLVGGVLATIL